MDLVIAFLAGMFALHWTWLIAAMLVFFGEIFFSHQEMFGLATLITLLGIAGIGYFGADLNVFVWSWHNPLELFQFSVVYLFLGGVWSAFKWYRYSLKSRDDLLERIDRWEKKTKRRAAEVEAAKEPGHKPGNRDSHWAERNPRPTRNLDDVAADHMDDLLGWVAHWPFSMVGYLIGDLIVDAVRHVVEALSGVYQRISDQVFKGID